MHNREGQELAALRAQMLLAYNYLQGKRSNLRFIIKDIAHKAADLIEVTGGNKYVYKRRKGIQSSQFAN